MEVPTTSDESDKWKRDLFFNGEQLGLNDLDYVTVWMLRWIKHPTIDNLWFTYIRRFNEKNTGKGMTAHLFVVFSRLNSEKEFWGPYKWGKIYMEEMRKAAYDSEMARQLYVKGVSFVPKGFHSRLRGWGEYTEVTAGSRSNFQRRLATWLGANTNWNGKSLAPYANKHDSLFRTMEQRLKAVADGTAIQVAQMRARHFQISSTAQYISQGGDIVALITKMARLIVLDKDEWEKTGLNADNPMNLRLPRKQPATGKGYTGTRRSRKRRGRF